MADTDIDDIKVTGRFGVIVPDAGDTDAPDGSTA